MQPLRAAAHSKRMASEREDVPPRSVNPRVLRLTCPDADHTADHRSRSTSLRHPRPTTVRRRYDDTPSDLDQTFFADRSGVRSLRSFSSAELCFSSFSAVMPWVHSFIQLSACRAGLSQSLSSYIFFKCSCLQLLSSNLSNSFSLTRIRSVECGICPIAARYVMLCYDASDVIALSTVTRQ